jgi:hypothetical protein
VPCYEDPSSEFFQCMCVKVVGLEPSKSSVGSAPIVQSQAGFREGDFSYTSGAIQAFCFRFDVHAREFLEDFGMVVFSEFAPDCGLPGGQERLRILTFTAQFE